MSQSELMEWTEDDKINILKRFDLTPNQMEAHIKTVQEWIANQPHLPEVPPNAVVEKFLLFNDCDVEETKQKMENYYLARGRFPEFFKRHPLSPEMKEASRLVWWVVLPKLYDLHRILVVKVDCDPDQGDIEKTMAQAFNVVELRFLEDYRAADIIIVDLTSTSIRHTVQVTPMFIKKVYGIIRNMFCVTSGSHLHIIVSDSIWEACLAIVKSVVGQNISKRIHVHKSLESLQEFVPKEYLPKDFGGGQKSLRELTDLQEKCFEKYKKRFDDLMALKCDESLKPTLVDEDLFGTYGNFKQLLFD